MTSQGGRGSSVGGAKAKAKIRPVKVASLKAAFAQPLSAAGSIVGSFIEGPPREGFPRRQGEAIVASDHDRRLGEADEGAFPVDEVQGQVPSGAQPREEEPIRALPPGPRGPALAINCNQLV